VDKPEWYMSPQTVNVLQPIIQRDCFSSSHFATAFYNYQADEAVNYGGIGAVIVTKYHMVLTIQERVTMPMEI
jgi:endothelin-converting enzyme/putative endopeptidase